MGTNLTKELEELYWKGDMVAFTKHPDLTEELMMEYWDKLHRFSVTWNHKLSMDFIRSGYGKQIALHYLIDSQDLDEEYLEERYHELDLYEMLLNQRNLSMDFINRHFDDFCRSKEKMRLLMTHQVLSEHFLKMLYKEYSHMFDDIIDDIFTFQTHLSLEFIEEYGKKKLFTILTYQRNLPIDWVVKWLLSGNCFISNTIIRYQILPEETIEEHWDFLKDKSIEWYQHHLSMNFINKHLHELNIYKVLLCQDNIDDDFFNKYFDDACKMINSHNVEKLRHDVDRLIEIHNKRRK